MRLSRRIAIGAVVLIGAATLRPPATLADPPPRPGEAAAERSARDVLVGNTLYQPSRRYSMYFASDTRMDFFDLRTGEGRTYGVAFDEGGLVIIGADRVEEFDFAREGRGVVLTNRESGLRQRFEIFVGDPRDL